MLSSWPNLREFDDGANTDLAPTRDEDLDLRLRLCEFSWSTAGERRDLRDTEGDLSLDQNSDPLSLGVGSPVILEVERDLDLKKKISSSKPRYKYLEDDRSGEVTEVTELEEDMIEDWRESEPIVLAASSNADLEDAEDNWVSVSTYLFSSVIIIITFDFYCCAYITASSWRENERARFEDTGWRPCLVRAATLQYEADF